MSDVGTHATDLGVISLTGAGASGFLRAQLTTDNTVSRDSDFGLTAWCDARGNTLAIVYLVPHADGYYIVTREELIEGLVRRLQMYVLRARVDIADRRGAFVVSAEHDAEPLEPGRRRDDGDRIHLGLTAGDTRSVTLTIRPTRAGGAPASSNQIDINAFELARIDAGVAAITLNTQACFVPQMLNLHWLGAVDFDKGCFPGQEVIARLQNRGRLAQRVFRYRWWGTRPAIGDNVFDADDRSRGTVLRAAGLTHAAADEGRLLAVVKISAASAPGPATASAGLELLDLPYPTPADVRPVVSG